MKSQIEQILIPTTQRTLGSEKAVKSVAEENGSLKVALEFGYPVAHIAQPNRLISPPLPACCPPKISVNTPINANTPQIQ